MTVASPKLALRRNPPNALSAPLRLCVILLSVVFAYIGRCPVCAEEPKPGAGSPATPTESKSPTPPKPAAADDELSVEQARLADRYKRLEEVVGRLAEVSSSSDPRRAKLLREAIAQSREEDVNVRFESIVKLLQDERLSAATTNQIELQKELDNLLSLLLKADRDNELNSQRDRVKAYLKEVGRLIRDQKSVRARTEGGDQFKQLGQDQQRIAGDTAKLGGDISNTEGKKNHDTDKSPKPGDKDSKSDKDEDKNNKDKDSNKGSKGDKPPNDKPSKPNDSGKPSDKPGAGPDSEKPSDAGKPSEGSPPSDSKSPPSDSPGQPSQSPPSQSKPTPGQPGGQPSGDDDNKAQQPPQPQDPAERATNELKKAQQKMEEAQKKLNDAKRKGATESQQEAVKQLEQAKAELERVLRQLREEELERTLIALAARFRKMLEMQTAVYDGTVKLDQVPEAQRTHDHEIESARLSRNESQIVHEVEKALAVLRDEGSSVAFPEAVDQMHDDMRQVAERLAAIKPDKLTQSIEQDIIAALEETIAALDRSIKDLDKKKTPPGQQSQAGQPEDMPLVDKIAELKMIRSLQMRINKRTQRYGEMLKDDQVETPDLLKSLQDLADRQQRVYRATADLQQKRND
ncbi:MAG TPA: hypothetical protein VH107_17795 [Lacipirellulaceae bacterium]|jgi:hypothetical protein|nr:hypothetical protein [Lacipirellulaceae bacterium]